MAVGWVTCWRRGEPVGARSPREHACESVLRCWKRLATISDLTAMRKQYDFGKMKGQRNPYVKQLKQPVTIRLDKATIACLKTLAGELGMPYQNLINLYLRDCALRQKKPALKWA